MWIHSKAQKFCFFRVIRDVCCAILPLWKKNCAEKSLMPKNTMTYSRWVSVNFWPPLLPTNVSLLQLTFHTLHPLLFFDYPSVPFHLYTFGFLKFLCSFLSLSPTFLSLKQSSYFSLFIYFFLETLPLPFPLLHLPFQFSFLFSHLPFPLPFLIFSFFFVFCLNHSFTLIFITSSHVSSHFLSHVIPFTDLLVL